MANKTEHNVHATAHELSPDPTPKGPSNKVEIQETNHGIPEYQGADHTFNDRQDMHRMGKKQELRRGWRVNTIFAFVLVAMGTWEFILASTGTALANGGVAGLVWLFLGSFVCFGTIVLSLAEMSSMAPTAGGQYHWASEFAPAEHQKFISYMSGWMSTLSWQFGICSGMFLIGQQVQALVAVTDVTYVENMAAWQAYLIVFALTSVGLLVNTWGYKLLPLIESLLLVLHILGWLVVVTVLWVLGPKNTTHDVFTKFQVTSGWEPTGLSMLIGQVLMIYNLTGSDSSAHLSEEIQDAGSVVPRSMVLSYLLNCSLGFVTLVTYCFCITDVTAALEQGFGFPYIYVFRTTTGSNAGTIGLTCIVIVLSLSSAIGYFASASRQTFAFARDKGLPGYGWISKVDSGMMIPLNSCLVTYAFIILVSLINLGSTTAFNAIIGVQLLSMMITYAISIGCLTLKRLKGEALPKARWSLGRFGLPVNVFAFVYSCFTMVFMLFPTAQPVTTTNMNWASVIFVGMVAVSLTYYLIHGRHVYQGPVVLCRKERL